MEWFERVTAVSCDGNGTARWVGACSLSHKVRGLSDQSRGNRYTSLFEVGLISNEGPDSGLKTGGLASNQAGNRLAYHLPSTRTFAQRVLGAFSTFRL